MPVRSKTMLLPRARGADGVGRLAKAADTFARNRLLPSLIADFPLPTIASA